MAAFNSLARDCRGTASVEAAVMLPVMAICWAALFLRFDSIDTMLTVAAESRQLAWTYSAEGCEGTQANVTVGCQSDGGKTTWITKAEKIPIIGWFIGSFLGYELTAEPPKTYTQPPLFGGGSPTLVYPYYLMCNEKSRSTSEVLTSMLCEEMNSLGLDLSFAVSCPAAPPHGENCNP
jgi:hypothetical protein